MTPEAALTDALDRVRAGGPVSRLGVAVSGGGDSMALLMLALDWCRAQSVTLAAATVDHGLRTESADEAQFVKDTCAQHGIDHTTLVWQGAKQGNLQHNARHARYDLLAGWSRDSGLGAVLLGHTADDQAETFVMRLARGSGVDGLAAMRADWEDRGMRWLRPLLGVTRAGLRDVLTTRNQTWVDDPSNEDPRFDRVRVRQTMGALAQLGLDRARLVDTAERMSQARDALSWLAHDCAVRLSRVEGGDVHFALPAFATLPDETRHRLLAHAITYVSSTPYRPRYDALRQAEVDALAGQTRSLQGCLISRRADALVIGREPQAVAWEQAEPGALWDGRWMLAAPDTATAEGLVVMALGDGIAQCKGWRATGFARTTLMTTPALWADTHLIAAPLAGLGDNSLLIRTPNTEEFLSTILSH